MSLILGEEAVWRFSHTVTGLPKSYENGRFIVTGHGQERGSQRPVASTKRRFRKRCPPQWALHQNGLIAKST
jgi:hypothetical protein